MPFAHMKYINDEKEIYDEEGVTKHTVERDYGTNQGTRFHCSSCGKKNTEHYLRTHGMKKLYPTKEKRMEHAKKNPGIYCYLKDKSKTCEPCLKLKREQNKLFGRKTKTKLAEEKQTLKNIIMKLNPDYKPQTALEADALGIKWIEPKQIIKKKKRRFIIVEDEEEAKALSKV